MNTNIKELKKIMLEGMSGRSFNYELMSVLNCSYTTAISRLSGRSKFTVKDAGRLKQHYGMTDEQFLKIFYGG